MGEPMYKNGKVMHYMNGKNIRELVEKANAVGVQREDIVSILSGKDYYYMIYYYGESESEQ